MRELTLETVAEALWLLVEIAATIGLSTVGLLAERAGIERLASGVDPLTIWFLVIGTAALYGGVYVLGYETLSPRLVDRIDGSGA